MPEPDTTSEDDVAAYFDVVGERSLGADTDPIGTSAPPSATERIAAARDQLAHAEALAVRPLKLPRHLPGPPGRELVRRLAQVPVTHQVEVNQELIAAHRNLATALTALIGEVGDLRNEWRDSDIARAAAGVTGLREALGDLAARNDELATILTGLDARTESLAEELAARRATERRDEGSPVATADHPESTSERSTPAPGDRATPAPGDRATPAGHPGTPPAELAALLTPEARAGAAALAPLAAEVATWLGDGTLRDLASDRGRWLGLVSDEASGAGAPDPTQLTGWERDPARARLAGQAGIPVTVGTWAEALAASGSAPRIITAVDLAPRLTPDELDALVRGVATTLEPGGTLVMAHPRADGTVLWLDPAARRPVPNRLVEALALAAGFTEVASRLLDDERVAVIARGAGGRPPAR